ncbi:MAG: UDP-N-acetylglucosamine 1-carboxyvinyltransferase [Candidatus Levyibacteriota bacterium]|nr:MAG: UDP-N-acetylglucosamine 1-carboxyvinyltransferase [Candidatus Levybacteria bacterium]
MEKFIINGGKKLRGEIRVSGAKNVALKALVAACLTSEEVIIDNVPHILDVFTMIEIIKDLGGKAIMRDHTVTVRVDTLRTKIPFDKAVEVRTSSMFLAPLLARAKEAIVPNPGGCRIGARPINRIIKGLRQMGAIITYNSKDGYFHAKAKQLKGVTYEFKKNTHTGTETMIMASVLAKGKTILKNAALEPEIDELIAFLNGMGAKIKRHLRTITIEGVEELHGAHFTIGPDRNEAVTYAIAGIITEGEVIVDGILAKDIKEFLGVLDKAGGGYEEKADGMRFFYKGKLKPTDISTSCYPGFMTDWQSPWAVLMTKAKGTSSIHETVFESRFGYVEELKKMGAHIAFFNPKVDDPKRVYNFNLSDAKKDSYHAISVSGPAKLHNAVVNITDLRAGATLVLASLAGSGTSVVFGAEKLDRGYEKFDKCLVRLGADIKRVKD